ncbi:MAG: CBS domain-containing protein [Sulfolobales archaeon]|nr:CBS domain-containing protein [Sulfolobales archaeon]MCX8199001.1 CBS domain-containing protein [Sulfolobales archaeon]MDW8169980.1 CBS domain-containing protein [Desulfurococcaceae archaeon]
MSYHSVKVSELIKRPPVTVLPTATVEEAAKLMYSEGVGSVVITSPEGRVLGIFTERDLVRVVGRGIPLTTRVGEVMTKNPVTIRTEDALTKAVLILAERKIRHLPVVDEEGRVRGVISARDIASTLKKYLEELGEVCD